MCCLVERGCPQLPLLGDHRYYWYVLGMDVLKKRGQTIAIATSALQNVRCPLLVNRRRYNRTHPCDDILDFENIITVCGILGGYVVSYEAAVIKVAEAPRGV